MSRLSQRACLALLPRGRLIELARDFDLGIDEAAPTSSILDSLARSRRASFRRILTRLDNAELEKMLRSHGIESNGAGQERMRQSILGHRASITDGSSAQTSRNERSPYLEGRSFEATFRVYMEEALGFEKVQQGEWVKGKVSDRGYDCDLHGVRFPRGLEFWTRIGRILIVLALLGVFFPEQFTWLTAVAENLAVSISPRLAGWGLLGLLLVGLAIIGKAKRDQAHHVWVECKNRGATIKRTDVLKLARAAEDVAALESAKWRPAEVWLASKRSEFDQDALNFAREHGIRCFAWDDGKAREL